MKKKQQQQLIIVLLLCAAGYYFLVYLPEEENKKRSEEEKLQQGQQKTPEEIKKELEEDAKVKFTDPKSRLLNYPNKITDDDFAGGCKSVDCILHLNGIMYEHKLFPNRPNCQRLLLLHFPPG